MSELLKNVNYNPDVLSCLANLSNDEVFTPPALANQVLDMLPKEIWHNKNAKFLDPATKTGVFLREIAKRLIKGLEKEIPDLQQRLDHIYTQQLYGIAITGLTALLARRSLYCSKFSNGKYSVCSSFKNDMGNIEYKNTRHKWKDNNCVFCGASKAVYDRNKNFESYAYEFIHVFKPEDIFNMKFDVIVGNPPYQLSDGGNSASAKPIYQKFVEQAKKLKPRYMTMIIPSRWFSGGKGLDTFRDEMINDKHIIELHDFLNAADCFGNGVEIKGGVCYFLWDRNCTRKCKVITHDKSTIISTDERFLQDVGGDVFIRRNEAIPILKKVKNLKEETFEKYVSSRRPFGLATNFSGKKEKKANMVELYERGNISYIELANITRNQQWINKNKIYITKAYNAGDVYPHQILNKPLLGGKGSCCTETYIVIGPFETKTICENVISYISTRFFRFLVMLRKNTQDATQKVYSFVPMQDFSETWNDEKLYKKYDITKEEIAFIESMVRPMNIGGENDE
jgi:Eco57I restriction endonuclease.